MQIHLEVGEKLDNVKYVTIAGFDFLITKEIEVNNNHYMIAMDENKNDTITVLKKQVENGKEIVKSVEDDDELELVLELAKGNNWYFLFFLV